jgi:LytS/YehU family sensor histidine kinase
VLRWAVQKRLRVLTLEKDNLKLELDFLRAQINPHFFFNTLNSVYALVEDKDQTAAALVLSLSNMMRYALYDSATPEVDVAQELAFIQEYLDIQQIRHQRRLKIEVEIAPDLGAQRIPPMLLVTFLENAVKHGVDKLLRHAWVRVRAYRDELGTFCFAMTNAVPPAAETVPTDGIGLRNTRRRLHILYPDTHSLQISATATQYHILLRLWP